MSLAGLITAMAASSGGFDWQGLSSLIIAVTGLLSTLAAIYFGMRRKGKDADPRDAIVEAWMREHTDDDSAPLAKRRKR